MDVDYQDALEAYTQLPEELQSPYFHPRYVLSDASRNRLLKPIFFVYRSDGELYYHAFHLGAAPIAGLTDIQSPYGYGGPLASTVNPAFLSAATQAYVLWCRQHRVLAEFIRFHPLLANWVYYAGDIWPLRQTVWVNLEEGGPSSGYSGRVRTATRNAVKNGLRVSWVDSAECWQDFVRLYIAAMEQLEADRFYFFSNDYFCSLLSWQQSQLAFCLKEDNLLAAALFLRGSHIMEYHLAAANGEGKRLSASNLLLDRAATRARELGCRRLHLGGGTDNRPDNPLLFFKSGFSQDRRLFMIGKTIYTPDAYEKLRRDWQARYGTVSERVLFYRSP